MSAQVWGALFPWGGLGCKSGVAAVMQGCSVSSRGVFAVILFYKSSLGLWPPCAALVSAPLPPKLKPLIWLRWEQPGHTYCHVGAAKRDLAKP